uniref:Calcineurin-binding protein cabin-1-like n=1 Tax=Saccoglossus kowalevskii TaxID=10224 RepID=A0ABM0M298_SACKO|nr:PREDICTED: calcineurin-binding protein cabin-1-like [Saccoglossus kowalevskii]
MKLCLTRFPQHYKSLYRLSRFYLYAETHKNIQWSRDLLMGTSYLPWYQYKHMPAQGLFAERNKSNFFNGIWRIPVEEIDRPGSFPSHMHRSVTLLLEVLLKNKDYKALFQVSSQLQRTPDQGKKYLRDVDRILLAKVAYDNVLAVIKGKLERMDKVNHCEDEALQLLLESYRVWQYGSAKLQTQMDTANRVLGLAYTVYKRNQLSDSSSPLEQAIRYCSGYSSLHRQPQTPTYGDFSLHFPTKATGKEDADVSSQKKSDQLVTPSDEPKSNKRKLEAIDIVAALESSSSKKSQDVVMKTPEKTSSRSPTFSSSPGLKLLQKAATSFQESFIASQALAKSLSPVKLTPSPTLTSAQVLTTIPTVTTSQSKVSSLADSKKEQGALSSQSKHSLSVPITTTDSAKPPSNTTPDVQSPSSGYKFKGPPSVVSAPPMKALPGGHVSTSKLDSPSAAVNVLPDHKAGSAIMPPYNPRPYTSAFTASEEYRPPSTTVIVSPASSSDAASILQAHGPLSSSVSPSRPPSQSRMAQASPSKVGFAGLSAKQLSGIAESRDFGSW